MFWTGTGLVGKARRSVELAGLGADDFPVVPVALGVAVLAFGAIILGAKKMGSNLQGLGTGAVRRRRGAGVVLLDRAEREYRAGNVTEANRLLESFAARGSTQEVVRHAKRFERLVDLVDGARAPRYEGRRRHR